MPAAIRLAGLLVRLNDVAFAYSHVVGGAYFLWIAVYQSLLPLRYHDLVVSWRRRSPPDQGACRSWYKSLDSGHGRQLLLNAPSTGEDSIE